MKSAVNVHRRQACAAQRLPQAQDSAPVSTSARPSGVNVPAAGQSEKREARAGQRDPHPLQEPNPFAQRRGRPERW